MTRNPIRGKPVRKAMKSRKHDKKQKKVLESLNVA